MDYQQAVKDYINFKNLSPKDKMWTFFDEDMLLQSFVFTQQLDKKGVLELIRLAHTLQKHYDVREFRQNIKTILGGYSCVLYFTQPSSRTFLSFSLAAQALGMSVEEIRDPSTSSAVKGETEIDTLLTMAALTDLIVMRQNSKSLIEDVAFELKVRGLKTRLINGGSGTDQHPTQALLDVYTLGVDRNLNGTYKVAMMGDLKHSRTVRSLSYMLAMFNNVQQIFIAPDEYQIEKDITDHLTEHGVVFTLSNNKAEHIRELDGLYIIRLQDEYHELGVKEGTFDNFKLYAYDLSIMKEDAAIMHPLPRRDEIPVFVDFDSRAEYWEAVEKGKFIRMALILTMFGYDDEFWFRLNNGSLLKPALREK